MDEPTLTRRKAPSTGPEDGYEMVFPTGLRVLITRVPVVPRSQLAIFINTEDMGDTDHVRDPAGSKYPGGIPEMEILLNDAVLYDCEPGTKGRNRVVSTSIDTGTVKRTEKYALRLLAASTDTADEAFSDVAADLYRERWGEDFGDETFRLEAVAPRLVEMLKARDKDTEDEYIAPLWIIEHVDNVTTGASHTVGKIHAKDRGEAESLAQRKGLLPPMQAFRIIESTDPRAPQED